MTDEERQEKLEYENAIINIQMILETQTGCEFMKYLFKHFDVGQLPELGLEGSLLSDRLGSLRPGRALFDIVSKASPQKASSIFAEIERERHDFRETEENVDG